MKPSAKQFAYLAYLVNKENKNDLLKNGRRPVNGVMVDYTCQNFCDWAEQNLDSSQTALLIASLLGEAGSSFEDLLKDFNYKK